MSWGSGCGLGLCLSQVVPDPCSLLAVKQEPAPPAASPKPALSEEELEKKSKAIIEEYLHINDMKVRRGWPGTAPCDPCNTPSASLGGSSVGQGAGSA